MQRQKLASLQLDQSQNKKLLVLVSLLVEALMGPEVNTNFAVQSKTFGLLKIFKSGESTTRLHA